MQLNGSNANRLAQQRRLEIFEPDDLQQRRPRSATGTSPAVAAPAALLPGAAAPAPDANDRAVATPATRMPLPLLQRLPASPFDPERTRAPAFEPALRSPLLNLPLARPMHLPVAVATAVAGESSAASPAASPTASASATPVPRAPSASAQEIVAIELLLAEPIHRELIAAWQPPLLQASGPTPGSVRADLENRYGAERLARMERLSGALRQVEGAYAQVLDAAVRTPDSTTAGAIWVDEIPGRNGDADEPGVRGHWRLDPVAFTNAYAQGTAWPRAPLLRRTRCRCWLASTLRAPNC